MPIASIAREEISKNQEDAERALTHLLLSTEAARFWALVLAAFGFGVMNWKVRVGKMTAEPILGFATSFYWGAFLGPETFP